VDYAQGGIRIVLFSRSKGVVGLDIGSYAIKLVELSDRKGEFHLERVGVEPLSPEAIVDGSIMDSSLVVDAIQRLIEQTGVRSGQFATSVSGHSVIIKKIQVPAMGENELADSIQWEAEQYIPFDIHDVRLDYVVLSRGEPGRDSIDVLLVAVKRDKINDYTSVISQAGKSPVLVDVDALALQNAFELNYEADPGAVVALINMGASVSNITILSQGTSVFWRDISWGGNQFSERLQREFNLSHDQAENLKRGQAVEDHTLTDAQPVLDAASRELAVEIQKTFDFFMATTSQTKVERLYLSGGCALTPNLREIFQEKFSVPVELMNPLRRIHYNQGEFHDEWLEAIAPTLAIAVGLAIRKVGD